ncbi:MAG: hypothetical protein J2P35_24020 [Actinobacteria bacterium]|nr:hypothetical protein [Actinomycetota bacterium]
MAKKCITCGAKLHPDRARKYSYCTAPACQEQNATGLTMVAVGMNKAADELMILDEQTRADLASGKLRDQRRGSFGTSAAAPARRTPGPAGAPGQGERPARSQPARQRQHRRKPAAPPARTRRPWSARQERLALLYNEQGLRPDEIAAKLGVSPYLATQIVLAARSRPRN